jgi:hypothetical protein
MNNEISKYINSSYIIHQEKLTENIVLIRAIQSNILYIRSGQRAVGKTPKSLLKIESNSSFFFFY